MVCVLESYWPSSLKMSQLEKLIQTIKDASEKRVTRRENGETQATEQVTKRSSLINYMNVKHSFSLLQPVLITVIRQPKLLILFAKLWKSELTNDLSIDYRLFTSITN